MSEADFARAVVQRLQLMGRRVLRVSDGTDARRGLYGLRALTRPSIDSTGADYLVLPREGMRVELVRSSAEVARVLESEGPCFVELKDPFAKERNRYLRQVEQQEWMRFVSGEKEGRRV